MTTRRYYHRGQARSKSKMTVTEAVVLLVILVVWLRWLAPWPLDWFISTLANVGSDDTTAAIVESSGTTELSATTEPSAVSLTASDVLHDGERQNEYLPTEMAGYFSHNQEGGNQSGQRLAVPSNAGMT